MPAITTAITGALDIPTQKCVMPTLSMSLWKKTVGLRSNTVVATLAGLAGGLVVSWLVLDLSPNFFLQRIVENVSVSNFWIAMIKAPVMAVVIAGIGCRQGMEVGGDVLSLGRRVTSAVVHAIFSIILIDALFALLYMELKL